MKYHCVGRPAEEMLAMLLPLLSGGGSSFQRVVLFFFFSSRRRHTRLQGDWSSDVCSSDLIVANLDFPWGIFRQRNADRVTDAVAEQRADADGALDASVLALARFGDAEMKDRKSVV